MKDASVRSYFLPYQLDWIYDHSPLKIVEKGRQLGFTQADAYDSVRKVTGLAGPPMDVWVSSRDDETAKQYLRAATGWAKVLDVAAADLGLRVLDRGRNITSFVLRFASGCCIYCVSSSPDALVGKTGHIKLDEFAVHKDQAELYRIAKPCTQWGGQLSIISTHRSVGSVFNRILREIKSGGNPMGWSHHRVTLKDAVDMGLVEKINKAAGRSETREAFVARMRAECIDEAQWLQEYCCQPPEDRLSFLGRERVNACVDESLKLAVEALPEVEPRTVLYAGCDIGRTDHLFVLDVGILVGDVVRDLCRIEKRGYSFAEMESTLESLLLFSQVRRVCLDATGLGMQLAESLKRQFGSRVEPVSFSAGSKEAMAYQLYRSFDTRRVRIPLDGPLIEDLCGVRKTVTGAGNVQISGEVDDSHCDRFWAKALREWAARNQGCGVGAACAKHMPSA